MYVNTERELFCVAKFRVFLHFLVSFPPSPSSCQILTTFLDRTSRAGDKQMTFSAPFLELSSERTFMSSGLTFEVWHYISRFIPDDQLYNLYPVNRAFFYIAMPLRYNIVSLSGQVGKYVGVM